MAQLLRVAALLAAAIVAACTQLPVDGPASRDITTGAVVHVASDRRAIAYDYALVDINPLVLESLSQAADGTISGNFNVRDRGPPAPKVGVGDIVQVSVFESAAGGLFQALEGGKGYGFYVTMPPQTVGRSGNIAVPYAGSIRVAGRPVGDVEREIEKKLAARAIEPQVVLSIMEQNSTSVTVIGEGVNGANRLKLSGAGERILDVISRAGGTRFPSYELFVTLHRDGRRGTVHFPRIVDDPRENIYVAPGDTVYVSRLQQKFMAVGALGSVGQTSGLTGQFAFEQERLSLNEALAKAGGLMDSRADPSQVFIYRVESREMLEKMGVDCTRFPPDQKWIPTVYRANFRDPSSFIFASRFPMRHKDLIYVANADANEVVKFLAYARSITSTVSGVASDVRLTGDIVSGRHILDK